MIKTNIFKSNIAVSQVLSTILVLSIVLSCVAGIMAWGVPYIEENKMKSQRETIFSNFEVFDNTIANLLVDGPNSADTGVISSNVDEGAININSFDYFVEGSTDRLVLWYSYHNGTNFTVEGLDDADDTFSVMPTGSDLVFGDWAYESYSLRKKLTINSEYVDEDLSNFPVLVRSTVFTATDDNKDIIFADESGTKLDYEIESLDEGSGYLIAWVNIPYVSSTEDTVFYLYSNNAEEDDPQENSEAVWDSDYILVHHFEETATTTVDDSTSNQNDGNFYGLTDMFRLFYINGALDFNGSSNYIDLGDISVLDSVDDLTIETLIFPRQETYSDSTSLVGQVNYSNPNLFGKCWLTLDTGLKWGFTIDPSAGDPRTYWADTSIQNSSFQYLVTTFDDKGGSDGSLNFYLDGESDGSNDNIEKDLTSSDEDWKVGWNGNIFFNGTLDEIRISKTIRDPSWIKANYNNLFKYDFVEQGYAVNQGGALFIDDASIYHLDPGKEEDIDTKTYVSIYDTYKYSQSFKCPFENDELDKIKLYIGKVGNIYDSLTVSIYGDSGGSPDPTDNLGSFEIYSDNVSTTMDWVECDFYQDIPLLQDTTYHIVVNTSSSTGSSGFYKWRYENPSVYEDGYAKYYDGFNWVYIESDDEYDLYKRIVYKNYDSPSAPKISGSIPIRSNPYGYSGVKYNFLLNNEDMFGDNYWYKADWGDGTTTGWCESGTTFYTNHTWTKTGLFNPVFKIRKKIDSTDVFIENEFDNETLSNLYIHEGISSPVNILDYGNPQITDGSIITTNINLNGTVLINLFNDAYPAEFGPQYMGKIPFARIWVFDLGSIEYTVPSISGVNTVSLQNGAVLSNGFSGFSNSFIKNEPAFVETDKAIALRLIQTKGIGAMAGSGRYKINVVHKASYNCEKPTLYFVDNVSNFKMQFSGSNSDIWLNYFLDNYDFGIQGDTLFYKHNERILLLDNSLFEYYVGGIY